MESIDVNAVNAIAEFLALQDRKATESRFDSVILCGTSVLAAAERAFEAILAGRAPQVLICGGIGHATVFLEAALLADPRFGDIGTQGRSEAEILGTLALGHWGLTKEQILLETQSTNCAENASMSRALLGKRGLDPKRILLIQDPLMQRRSDASFRKVYADRPDVVFVNGPPFVPRVALDGESMRLEGPGAVAWPLRRFFSVLLGEIPRLRNDASGYGPKGRGFIAAVAIPEAVEEAYQRLHPQLAAYGDRVRLS